MKINIKYIIIKTALVILTLFLGITFFVWTIYPNLQIAAFHRAVQKTIKTGDTSFVTSSNFFFEPHTSIQPMLRYLFTSVLITGYNSGKKDLPVKLMPFAIEKLEESLPTTSPYLNTYLNLGKGYDILGIVNIESKQSKIMFSKAEEYYKKALALVPYQQTTIIAYSINLYNQGKIDEAINLLRDSLEQDDRIPDLHYYLGQYLVYQNEKNSAEGLREIEISYNLGADIDVSLSQKTYQKMLFYFAKVKDKENIIIVLNRLAKIDERQSKLYSDILDYIKEHDAIPVLELNK